VNPDKLWARLDAFARSLEPGPRAAFVQAIQRLRESLPPDVLEYVARTGDTTPIFDRLDLSEFTLALRDAVFRASNRTPNGDAAGLPFGVRFDAYDPYALRAIQGAELSLVSGLTTEMKQAIVGYLQAGLQAGVNPVETARNLRPLLGLTARQMTAAANYRRLLTGGAKGQPLLEALSRASRDGRFDPSILRAALTKQPMPEAQVARQVARFEERLLKQRAETLARTETITALFRGQQLRWQQAIDQGKVESGHLRQFWHVAKDERTCPICREIPVLNPEGVAFGDPFETPLGPVAGPAMHPNCRCVVFTRIAFQKAVLKVWARELSGLRRAA